MRIGALLLHIRRSKVQVSMIQKQHPIAILCGNRVLLLRYDVLKREV